jgi:hypothetical protein
MTTGNFRRRIARLQKRLAAPSSSLVSVRAHTRRKHVPMTETAQEKSPPLMPWTNRIPTEALLTSMIDGVLIDVALALLELSKVMATGKISKAEVIQRATVIQRAAIETYMPPLAGPGEATAEIDRQWEIERATSMISAVTSRLEVRLDDAKLQVQPVTQRRLDRMRENETLQRRLNAEDRPQS